MSVGPSHQAVQFTSSIKFAKLDCFKNVLVENGEMTADEEFSVDNLDSLETAKGLWLDQVNNYVCDHQERVP